MRIHSCLSVDQLPLFSLALRRDIDQHVKTGNGQKIAVVLAEELGTACGEDLIHDDNVSAIYLTDDVACYQRLCEEALSKNYSVKGVVEFAMADGEY